MSSDLPSLTPVTENSGGTTRFPHESRCANADIAVLELRGGNFELTDSEGSTVTPSAGCSPMTLREGRVWYERPGE